MRLLSLSPHRGEAKVSGEENKSASQEAEWDGGKSLTPGRCQNVPKEVCTGPRTPKGEASTFLPDITVVHIPLRLKFIFYAKGKAEDGWFFCSFQRPGPVVTH